MSWLLPSALAIAGAASLITVALHFIARSRPIAEPLPTARFIPEQRVQARARSFALSDVVLLLVRLAALLVFGAAVAGPVFAAKNMIVRIVLADRSRGVSNPAGVRDSVRAYLRTGDQLVVFDSAAVPQGATLDSITATTVRGSLSAALAIASRAAVRLATAADSIELVVVSPFSREEMDDATLKIRNSWPGRIRLVPVAAAESRPDAFRVEIAGALDPNDPVVAGMSLMGVLGGPAQGRAVRLVRSAPSAADTLWARSPGNVLVVWPSDDPMVAWPHRPSIDTIGGVTSSGGTMIAKFLQQWALEGRAIARWADGSAAAVERVEGGGCIRDVGIMIDGASDITLRHSFRGFVSALLAPCGGARTTTPIDASVASALARGANLSRLAPAAALRDASNQTSRFTPWLLALGALLLFAELAVRRTGTRFA